MSEPAAGEPAAEPPEADWAAVLEWLPVLEEPGFSSAYAPHLERDGEVSRSGPATYADAVHGIISALYDSQVVYPFDWLAWRDEAHRLSSDPVALAEADLASLRKLLTTHVREERFCEGHFADVVDSGHLADILRRAAELLEEAHDGRDGAAGNGD